MPAFNEGDRIEAVLREWLRELDSLEIDYSFRIYDDGSTDETARIINDLCPTHSRLDCRTHKNKGHGPTVLLGYRDADCDWVFQTDSDGEVSATHFRDLWSRRQEYDLLLGYRVNRNSNLARKTLSWAARKAVSTLFSVQLRDVNVPFRLIRTTCLKQQLPFIPEGTLAPNVFLTGLIGRAGGRIYEHPVEHQGSGSSSISTLGILRFAIVSLWQAARIAYRRVRGG
jgi:glycosyltransferase involved in cell wall biosynthesis